VWNIFGSSCSESPLRAKLWQGKQNAVHQVYQAENDGKKADARERFKEMTGINNVALRILVDPASVLYNQRVLSR